MCPALSLNTGGSSQASEAKKFSKLDSYKGTSTSQSSCPWKPFLPSVSVPFNGNHECTGQTRIHLQNGHSRLEARNLTLMCPVSRSERTSGSFWWEQEYNQIWGVIPAIEELLVQRETQLLGLLWHSAANARKTVCLRNRVRFHREGEVGRQACPGGHKFGQYLMRNQ